MLSKPRLVRCLDLVALIGALVLPLAAQSVPLNVSIANDPDVIGAERLFSAWIEGQIAYRGLPGVAVGVVSDQQLVWSTGYGFADINAKLPMTAKTKFRIASNSKLFTAIAIMQLREQGKLGLDDPVVKHLPWFKEKAAGDDDGPITIEQLLSHSSGLQREAGDHWASNKFPSTDEIERLYADRQAPFAPSVRWKYSNFAFALAGLVVEKVSGTPWADFVERNIFKPLGMDSSSVDKNVAGLAVPYGRRMPDGSREVVTFIDSSGMAAATGASSNVEDLARFLSAQFRRGPRGGRQIVSGGSWREMLRVRSVEEDWTSGTGLGFDVYRVKGKTYVGHAGAYPGNTTQTLIQLDDKVGVIVLTNTNDSFPADIAQQLMASVGEAVAKAAMTKPLTLAWDPAWERFAGLYRGLWGDRQVVLLNKKLVVIMPNAPNLDSPILLEPLGSGEFRFAAPTGGGSIFGVVGEKVRFVEQSGRPVRMYFGDTWIDRVPEQ